VDDRPALLVLDDLESADGADLAAIADLAGGSRRPNLTLAIVDDDAPDAILRATGRLAQGGTTVQLGPIDDGAIAAIIAVHGGSGSGPGPIQAIAQASEGVPARAHALAAEWAQGEVARRLGSSASRAAEGRRGLRVLEGEVASHVIDLQLARERVALYAEGARRTEDCPWKGLASFNVADADLFFGRERLVAEMVGDDLPGRRRAIWEWQELGGPGRSRAGSRRWRATRSRVLDAGDHAAGRRAAS
jgi:hypothetical protein